MKDNESLPYGTGRILTRGGQTQVSGKRIAPGAPAHLNPLVPSALRGIQCGPTGASNEHATLR